MEVGVPFRGMAGRRLMVHKMWAKKKELEIKVEAIREELVKLECYVTKLLEACTKVADEMKSKDWSFSACSSSLGELDDKIAIIHCMIDQVTEQALVDYPPKPDKEENGETLEKSKNILEQKISSKALSVTRDGESLLVLLSSLKQQLSKVLEDMTAVDETLCSFDELSEVFCDFTRDVVTREEKVTTVWRRIAGWQEVTRKTDGNLAGIQDKTMVNLATGENEVSMDEEPQNDPEDKDYENSTDKSNVHEKPEENEMISENFGRRSFSRAISNIKSSVRNTNAVKEISSLKSTDRSHLPVVKKTTGRTRPLTSSIPVRASSTSRVVSSTTSRLLNMDTTTSLKTHKKNISTFNMSTWYKSAGSTSSLPPLARRAVAEGPNTADSKNRPAKVVSTGNIRMFSA